MDFDASNTRMKKSSPIYPGYEGGDYGFDPQLDFSQFLEEAKKHASKGNFEAAPQYQEAARKGQSDGAKKNRKSWKRSLFSWWKTDKKSNFTVEPRTSLQISQPKRGHISSSSGPIYGSGSGVGSAASCKPRRPTSGPITSLFHPTKKVENETPYLCLDKLNDLQGVQSYGPVYLVT